MSRPPIALRGVRVHNLKNVDIDIPSNKLVAFCGVSGSGKTSLALDTLYAEGQRRYIESFSAYTRQFLQRLDKPDYDRIDHLPPAIAVTRGHGSKSNRSTIGTASEVNDFVRLLFAKIASLHCHGCGRTIESFSPQVVASLLASLDASLQATIVFEIHWEDQTDLAYQLAELQQSGFVRLVAGGQLFNLGRDDRESLATALSAQTNAFVAVDRVRGGTESSRSLDSLETAFQAGQGRIGLLIQGDADKLAPLIARVGNSDRLVAFASESSFLFWFNRDLRCHPCNIDYPRPEPRLFSFNSPLGACPKCEGFGDVVDLDMNLIVPDRSKSIREGAIAPWNTPAYEHELHELLRLAKDYRLPVDIPFGQLTPEHLRIIQEGVPEREFGGLRGFFQWLEKKKYKMHIRVFLSRWRSYSRCDACSGQRLSPKSLSFRISGKNIAEFCELEIDEAHSFLESLKLSEYQSEVAGNVLNQLKQRLSFLQMVGLGYLSLSRTLRTLSGGEAQRVSLTTALGSSLVNTLYVLDEPTVGLHPMDTERLLQAIERLRDRGNSVVVVDHEEEIIRRADWIVEIGPTAGELGGKVVFQGDSHGILKPGASVTGDFLAGRRGNTVSSTRRPTNRGWLKLTGATGYHLKNVTAEFPLGVLCLVTGVSGAGKSTLVQETLYGALCKRKRKEPVDTLPYEELTGDGQIDDFILVDQSSISRSPRSNPVTFIKAFDEIRTVFSETIDAKTHNYSSSHFSFNHESGRCPKCEGSGQLEIDMQFLADIQMRCPQCMGTRYRHEILQVRYRDRNIAEVLEMTARQAMNFFRGQSKLLQKLQVLVDVGLGYLALGQSALTLSAGEAQRLKLASFLASASKRRTLFILDEPTTGLHFQDVVQLLDCFQALLEGGHSLLVIEHNLQLMLAADYIIDMGPGASHRGGQVIATGTPEQVAENPDSITGQFIKKAIERYRQTETED